MTHDVMIHRSVQSESKHSSPAAFQVYPIGMNPIHNKIVCFPVIGLHDKIVVSLNHCFLEMETKNISIHHPDTPSLLMKHLTEATNNAERLLLRKVIHMYI